MIFGVDMGSTWGKWFEGSDDFRGVIIQLFGCHITVVVIPFNKDEECVRDALLEADVLWCVSLGVKL